MKFLKGFGISLCLIVICLLVAPTTKANEQPGNAAVTFGVPVEVPGIGAQILPAGNYLFTALESTPDRDIIQISSPDGSHVFTTMVGVPNSRLKAPDLITVVFTDRPAADPLALKAWYCPGRSWGDTIVYEKPRAIQLAKEANEAVLSTSVAPAHSSIVVLKTAAIDAVSPTGETVALAQVVDAPSGVAPALAVAVVPAATTMPNSAEVPTVALPAAEPAVAQGATVASGPAVADTPAAAVTPTAATEPPATSTLPATTDPAIASAHATIGEPVATPAPAVSAEPMVAVVPAAAVAPVVPVEPPVEAQPVAVVAPAVAVQPAAAPAPEVASAALPTTASVLPLIGLVGMLMLGLGLLMTGIMRLRG